MWFTCVNNYYRSQVEIKCIDSISKLLLMKEHQMYCIMVVVWEEQVTNDLWHDICEYDMGHQ